VPSQRRQGASRHPNPTHCGHFRFFTPLTLQILQSAIGVGLYLGLAGAVVLEAIVEDECRGGSDGGSRTACAPCSGGVGVYVPCSERRRRTTWLAATVLDMLGKSGTASMPMGGNARPGGGIAMGGSVSPGGGAIRELVLGVILILQLEEAMSTVLMLLLYYTLCFLPIKSLGYSENYCLEPF
jgi:hypothetical protein